jgi:cob(I)alamin adenosyltransferase
MPIYTGTGDTGFTGLFDNQRVQKDDLRIQAYGTVDEVNSFLGLLRCEDLPAELDERLQQIQCALFELGASLATPGSGEASPTLRAGADLLEGWIAESEDQLPQLKTFVLPGGHREAAMLHVVRTVARRAERLFWALHRKEKLQDDAGIYLNRLSDLFFSWARTANLRHGVADVPWVSTDG